MSMERGFLRMVTSMKLDVSLTAEQGQGWDSHGAAVEELSQNTVDSQKVACNIGLG